jgi:hypothetical protein
MTLKDYRRERIRDMRLALNYLEAVPEIPLPYFGTLAGFADDTDDIGTIARAMKPVEKDGSGTSYYTLRRKFGTITVEVNFAHEQVCEKVVLRTETVPARLVEAYEREIIEWQCPPSLLDDEETETQDDVINFAIEIAAQINDDVRNEAAINTSQEA